MRDEPICKTCDGGRLRLVARRKHGELAWAFGSVLVVVAIASLVIWVWGLFDALGKRDLFHDGSFVLGICGWLVTSLLLGLVGAIATQTESRLVCSNCHAVALALSADEAEEWTEDATAFELGRIRSE